MQRSGIALDQVGPATHGASDEGIADGHIMMPEPTPTEGLRVAVTALGATSTIGLEGEWDLAGAPLASRAVAKTLEHNPERLVLDLSRLTFMDSSGVQAAVQLSERSHAENFDLTIVPGPRAVQRIFDICNLTETLPFVTEA